MSSRPDLKNESAAESDRYEELLVNPTILTLLSRRGDIDCGGLDYVIIRYGHFHQFVVPAGDGHISVALEPATDLGRSIPLLLELTRRTGQAEYRTAGLPAG